MLTGPQSPSWGGALTSCSGEASPASFLSLASLDSFSVSRTSCLMKPPGMTEKRGGGEDGGGLLSSSRICFCRSKGESSVNEPVEASGPLTHLQWSPGGGSRRTYMTKRMYERLKRSR